MKALIAIILCVCFFSLILERVDSQEIKCPDGCKCLDKNVRCIRQQMKKIPIFSAETNIIDLRYNHLTEILTESFSQLQHLNTIFLNENRLTKIHSKAFHNLRELKYLYLNQNQISHIASDAFKNLNKLQNL